MNIRTATLQDIDQIAAVEKECFPAAEAATKEAGGKPGRSSKYPADV